MTYKHEILKLLLNRLRYSMGTRKLIWIIKLANSSRI